MDIVHPVAQAYAERFTSPEDALLKEVHEFTLQHHPKAHMLSGHLQGKLLEMISCMIRPKRVLEIGTFTGYSAICLAKGLRKGGELHTIELREADAAAAKRFFEKKSAKKIILHIGDALKIIDELDENWDLVFIDADKVNYKEYFNRIFPKLRRKRFILVDNIFFHGEVFEAEVKGKNAKAVREFNEFIALRDDVEKLVLPIRDGLYLLRKI
jgi:predicted O-methyltransferase YrrM